jgi:hypothetical protein
MPKRRPPPSRHRRLRRAGLPIPCPRPSTAWGRSRFTGYWRRRRGSSFYAAAYGASLTEIREAGYAVSREEDPGWSAVSAPVMWGEAVYGAVSVLKPSSLMPEDLALPVAAITAAAERLTRLVSGESDAYPVAG